MTKAALNDLRRLAQQGYPGAAKQYASVKAKLEVLRPHKAGRPHETGKFRDFNTLPDPFEGLCPDCDGCGECGVSRK